MGRSKAKRETTWPLQKTLQTWLETPGCETRGANEKSRQGRRLEHMNDKAWCDVLSIIWSSFDRVVSRAIVLLVRGPAAASPTEIAELLRLLDTACPDCRARQLSSKIR
jgi:hypothetical protein